MTTTINISYQAQSIEDFERCILALSKGSPATTILPTINKPVVDAPRRTEAGEHEKAYLIRTGLLRMKMTEADRILYEGNREACAKARNDAANESVSEPPEAVQQVETMPVDDGESFI